ncbi:uncharacterized protein LOC112127582 isoform X4 [Cimex lectularius]|uniref:CCHamide n=1 Tax=Cimex lectularius TaxID=79782 RepID=A0A8I6SMJ8_CIMLE|nr:uncharacterized protein LOC112127582 isoform X4 [Cimex lectularius]
MQQTTLLIAVLFIVLFVTANGSPYRGDREARLRKTSNVRRGCTFYGHSCFGGHGKRSDESMDLQEQPDLYEQRLKSSEFFRQWLQAYRTGQVLE